MRTDLLCARLVKLEDDIRAFERWQRASNPTAANTHTSALNGRGQEEGRAIGYARRGSNGAMRESTLPFRCATPKRVESPSAPEPRPMRANSGDSSFSDQLQWEKGGRGKRRRRRRTSSFFFCCLLLL